MHATYKLGKNAKLISNFQYFSFQFFNFQFCHFSLLIFNCCQSNFQLLSIDSVTFISVSLSYSVYLRKPILSLPLSLSIRLSLSLKWTRSLSLSLSNRQPQILSFSNQFFFFSKFSMLGIRVSQCFFVLFMLGIWVSLF